MIHLLIPRIFILCLAIVLFHDTALGRQLVALKVLPENVGVFYEARTQQFQAIAVFDDGSEEDYTKKVSWSLTAYPFSNQKLRPAQVARIDNNGLATVVGTWGRVRVNALYPPRKPTGSAQSYITGLLLGRSPVVVPVWPKVAPAIYMLLFSEHTNTPRYLPSAISPNSVSAVKVPAALQPLTASGRLLSEIAEAADNVGQLHTAGGLKDAPPAGDTPGEIWMRSLSRQVSP